MSNNQEKQSSICPEVGSHPINQLYLQYQTADPASKEFFESRLLEETRQYALAIIRKFAPTLQDIEDVVQESVIRVWSSLDQFHGGSKFSTWCYPIIKNKMIDFIRAAKRKREIALLDWKLYDETPTSQSVGAPPDAFEIGDDDNEGHGTPISKQRRQAVEVGFNAEYDTKTVIEKLRPEDQLLINLANQGYSSNDLAERFKSIPKQIANGLDYIRVVLKHELTIYEIRLHTCHPDYQSLYKLDAGRFISDDGGKSYRPLPVKCLCRKQLTKLESRRLIDLGEVRHIFHQSKNGKPVVDSTAVWAAQAVRVPRVGLTSALHIQRAVGGNRQDQTDLEIAHEMDVTALRALIVPFRPNPDDGIAGFTSFRESRSKHCFKDYQHGPNEPRKTDPATILLESKHRPNCGKDSLAISVYPDGSTRHECQPGGCCYLAVWRAPHTQECPPEKVKIVSAKQGLPLVSALEQSIVPTVLAAANSV